MSHDKSPLHRVDDNKARDPTRALRRSTHTTRCALCVARTRGTRRRSRLGAAGSLPAGGGGGGGCLAAAGGGWGRLTTRGGGQRRRRRRGDFGLNTPFSILRLRGIFFSETCSLINYIFWCVAGERLKPQRSPTRKKMVTCFPPLQPACRLRARCAADAQRMRGLKPL